MKSLIVKRSVVLAGHKTSVSLEDAFWNSLKEIARAGNMTLPDLLAAIDSKRRHGNLSSTHTAVGAQLPSTMPLVYELLTVAQAWRKQRQRVGT
jgi:predicted DNA-binding ribbon-helix-helix protein